MGYDEVGGRMGQSWEKEDMMLWDGMGWYETLFCSRLIGYSHSLICVKREYIRRRILSSYLNELMRDSRNFNL